MGIDNVIGDKFSQVLSGDAAKNVSKTSAESIDNAMATMAPTTFTKSAAASDALKTVAAEKPMTAGRYWLNAFLHPFKFLSGIANMDVVK
jgi:hypothetical protein